MNENYKWFVEEYDNLCHKYGNSFLVIKDKTVLCSYETYAEAVKETRKTEELGTFIVQECIASGEMYQCCIASMNFS